MTRRAASFWEEREVVERFASRDPDLRLAALLDELPALPESLTGTPAAGAGPVGYRVGCYIA